MMPATRSGFLGAEERGVQLQKGGTAAGKMPCLMDGNSAPDSRTVPETISDALNFSKR